MESGKLGKQSDLMDRRELTDLLRDVIGIIAAGDIPEAKQQVARLRDLGFEADFGVGVTGAGPENVIRWYAGQIISITDQDAWYVMNSIINTLDKFVPATF